MEKTGSVLVVGGGIAGIQAALDLAESGFKVHIVEREPSIGGVMTQLDKTFPTNDCAMCILAPKLVGAGRHPNIQLHTYCEVKSLEGDEGDFTATIHQKARRVDPSKCKGCGDCASKCPTSAIDTYNAALNNRNAVYIRFSQAVPLTYAIDKDRCIGCGICSEVCKSEAIKYDDTDQEIKLKVGSVILAPGFEAFDPSKLSELGYGRYKNVVSSGEFERILSATGPYRGVVLRPSDGDMPKKVAFLQCVGSRDARVGNPYCSGVCCMYAIKEAVIAQEHNPGLEASVFFMDIRAFGKEFDDYYTRAEHEHGINFIRSRVGHVEQDPDSGDLQLTYEHDGEIKRDRYNMVVLGVGLNPPKGAEALAKAMGFKLNRYGFAETKLFSPLETSRKGVYVCGAFSGPKDIPDSVAQASGAAAKAAKAISDVRGSQVKPIEYPQERDVLSEEPRIGVFVCWCGINIGGVVNVPSVAEYTKNLPHVAFVEENLYTCSQDTQDKIKKTIIEYKLNRVVVASCTPRTHEPLFRATLKEAGLNEYLFEMANIRDQCSWVHMHEKAAATQKAKDLVRMAVAKAALLQPLEKHKVAVTPAALVVGGGVSGMTAALEIADQGYSVHLVEKEDELGGNMRRIKFLPSGEDPAKELSSLVTKVKTHPKINLYTGTQVAEVDGYVGNFETTLVNPKQELQVKHGVIIVATGGVEYTPKEYSYGKHPSVVTQFELEDKLHNGYKPNVVVMIQCVGSRNEEHPNCSRVCCTGAVNNALKIKEANNAADIYILYKDMRTYGFKEDYYRAAAEKGVVFIRYDDEHKPEVTTDGGLRVRVIDPVLKEVLILEPDTLVLSAGVLPSADNRKLAGMLKVPISKDGFFLEAHMKLRPLDFATEGIYLCGLAHSPKTIDECISQASGAAARALTILSHPEIEAEGAIAVVDEKACSGCQMCASVCEFKAIEMVKDGDKTHSHVISEVCKGCGVCAVTCPSGAITVGHFTDAEIISQVKAALEEAKQ